MSDSLLSGAGLFQGNIPSHVLDFVASRAVVVRYGKDTAVYSQGTKADEVFHILYKGIVHGRHLGSDGKERHAYWRFPGEQLGLGPCIAGTNITGQTGRAHAVERGTYDTTTYTVTECELLRITRSDMLIALQLSDTIIGNAVRSLNNRFLAYVERQESQRQKRIYALAYLLYEWDEAAFAHNRRLAPGDRSSVVALTATTEKLAEWAGIETDSFSTVINTLESEGHIHNERKGQSRGGNKITVTNSESLRAAYFPTYQFPSGI